MTDDLIEAMARAVSLMRRDSEEYTQHDEDIARAALAAIEAAGRRVVPVEPTERMLGAGMGAMTRAVMEWGDPRPIWAAMLAAAKEQP